MAAHRSPGVEELTPAHAAEVRALEPEVVLLGTGARQIFPANFFGAEFLRAGIGFEVMDTGGRVPHVQRAGERAAARRSRCCCRSGRMLRRDRGLENGGALYHE